MRKFVGLVVLLAAVILAVFLVGSALRPRADKRIVIGWDQEPNILNPLVSMTSATLLTDFYGRGVWDWDSQYNPYPIMVEQVPSVENGLVTTNSRGNTVVTYKLRAGMKWSDGQPITADDCLFYHRMYSDPSTGSFPRGNYPDVVESVEKKDALTLVMTYKVPWPDFQTDAYLDCRYPAHILQPILDHDKTLDNAPYFQGQGVVGYAPFTLESWVKGDQMTFVRNPYWDGQTPDVDKVMVRFVGDSTQMTSDLANGAVDLAFNFSDALAADYQTIPNTVVWSTTSVYQDALWFNVRDGKHGGHAGHPALQDVRVRQAIVYAIDRRTHSDALKRQGVEIPDAYDAEKWRPNGLPVLNYDPDKAKQLLDEAGWKDSDGDGIRDQDGQKLVLRFFTTPAVPRPDYQLAIQEDLKAVGIGVEVYVVPGAAALFANFKDRGVLSNGDYDLAIYALSNDPLSPNISQDNFSCKGIASPDNPEGQNSSGYCDPAFDRLIDPLRTTVDPEKRLDLKHQAVQQMTAATFWAGLYVRETYFAVNGSRFDADSLRDMGTYIANYFHRVEYWKTR